jgi:hypothetical protein
MKSKSSWTNDSVLVENYLEQVGLKRIGEHGKLHPHQIRRAVKVAARLRAGL